MGQRAGGDGGGVVGESVVSTDSVIDGSKVYEFGSDGDARTSQCGRCSDDATGGGSDFSFSVAGAAAQDEWKFEKVGSRSLGWRGDRWRRLVALVWLVCMDRSRQQKKIWWRSR